MRMKVDPIQPTPEPLKSNSFSEVIVKRDPVKVKFESIKSKEKMDEWRSKVHIERKYIDFPFRVESVEPLPLYIHNPKSFPSLVEKRESLHKGGDRKQTTDSSEWNEHALKLTDKYQMLESKVFDYFGFEDLIPMCGFSLRSDLDSCMRKVQEDRIVCKFVEVVGEMSDGSKSESVENREVGNKTKEKSMSVEYHKGIHNRNVSEQARRGAASEKTPAPKTKEKKELIVKKEEIDTQKNRFHGESEVSSAKHSTPSSSISQDTRNPVESSEAPPTKSSHSEPAAPPSLSSAEKGSLSSSIPHKSVSHSNSSPSASDSTPPSIPVEPSLPKSPTVKPTYPPFLCPPFQFLSMPPTSCFTPFSMLSTKDSNLYNMPSSLLPSSGFQFLSVPPLASVQGPMTPFLSTSSASIHSPASRPAVSPILGEMGKSPEVRRGRSGSLNFSNKSNFSNSLNPSPLVRSSSTPPSKPAHPGRAGRAGKSSRDALGCPERKKGQFFLYFPTRPSSRDNIQRLQTYLRVGCFRRYELPPVITAPPEETLLSAVETQREANVNSLYNTLVKGEEPMAMIVNIPPIYRTFTKKQLPKLK